MAIDLNSSSNKIRPNFDLLNDVDLKGVLNPSFRSCSFELRKN